MGTKEAKEVVVYFHNDNTAKLQKLDIDYPLKVCATRKMTFYNVDAISPANDTDGSEYGVIHTPADDFATPLTYKQLKEIFG